MAKPRINLGAVDLSDIDLQIVDVKKYDFDGLRSDVSNILSVQQIATTVIKWTASIALLGTVVAWFLFAGRMSSPMLILFLMMVLAALVLVGINAGIFFALRGRIAHTNRAAERVVELTSEVHADYLSVRSGETELPTGAVAATLTEQLIFPALRTGIMTATRFTGPLALALRPVVQRSITAVEHRALDALNNTPMPALGSGVAKSDAVMTGELLPDLPAGVGDWYESVHGNLRRVVGGVGTVATGSMGALLALSIIPLISLLILGWLFT